MNYFEYYQLPISYCIDLSILKKMYFAKSKEVHPDKNLDSSANDQLRLLENAAYNNVAYHTLKNQDTRLAYILSILNIISVDEKYDLDSFFLMDMIALNEELEDYQTSNDTKRILQLELRIKSLLAELEKNIADILASDCNQWNEKQRDKVKEYYYKKKYLQRLQEGFGK